MALQNLTLINVLKAVSTPGTIALVLSEDTGCLIRILFTFVSFYKKTVYLSLAALASFASLATFFKVFLGISGFLSRFLYL